MRRSLVALLLLAPALARAEGSTELGMQSLRYTTELYVDILDPTVETIVFTGVGRATVTDPAGTLLGEYASGEAIAPSPGRAGAYRLTLSADQTEAWDIAVEGVPSPGGRLHSYNWYLNGRSYGEDTAFSGSFYALLSGGAEGFTAVVEMKAEGLTGFEWDMAANARGVDGEEAGRSVPVQDQEGGNTFTPEFPIYINPPAKAAYDVFTPAVGELGFSGGVLGCDAIAPGLTQADFSFESNVEGNYHLVCDLNDDGLFDLSGDEDLTLSGTAHVGTNFVEWEGTDNGGERVSPGTFACRVTVTVGEFHYVAKDIETSYPGLRLFQVLADGSREGLPMFWNDGAVQLPGDLMPNGQEGLETSGPSGIHPGRYDEPTVANLNARSWGSFTELSKGANSLLDTFVWLEASTSAALEVTVYEGDEDSDGDGFTDLDELCTHGTDPLALAGYYRGGCATGSAVPGLLIAGLAGLTALTRRRGA